MWTSWLLKALIYVVIAVVGAAGVVLAVLLAVTLVMSVMLVGTLALQAVGVLRRVPFSYNVRNLVVRWPITLLTAAAFTMVVGIVTFMQAFVNGMDKLAEASGRPGNVIVLADGATDELFSNLGYGDITRIEQQEGVQRDAAGGPLVSWETYIVASMQIENAKPAERQRRFVQIRGVVDPARSGTVHDLGLKPEGQWFGEAGVDARGKEGGSIQGVMGEGIARELGKDKGKPSLEPGDHFQLGGRDWVVTGVMDSAGSTFDSEVWAKADLVGDLFGKKTRTTAVVRTADAAAAEQMAAYLTEQFKSPAVQAQPETKYYESLNATNKQFSYAIKLLAAFLAVGGVLGVMNAMYAAISQRTKDIGVLRILGYGRWQLLTSFFLEAILLGLVGGLLGCALGYLTADGRTATSILSAGQGGGGKTIVLKLVVDGRTLLAGMAFSLAMGCVGGLLPALQAMRLRPLESIR
jgi:ABC-type lipoprotein release transport system permease subunit